MQCKIERTIFSGAVVLAHGHFAAKATCSTSGALFMNVIAFRGVCSSVGPSIEYER